jgi:hypothetical protein
MKEISIEGEIDVSEYGELHEHMTKSMADYSKYAYKKRAFELSRRKCAQCHFEPPKDRSLPDLDGTERALSGGPLIIVAEEIFSLVEKKSCRVSIRSILVSAGPS